MTTTDYQQIVDAARAASDKAIATYLQTHGDNDCCGFAWVEVHPARGKFVNYCKKNGLGSSGYPQGWQFWISGPCQSLSALEAGANAFAKVLKDAAVTPEVYSRSRMD